MAMSISTNRNNGGSAVARRAEEGYVPLRNVIDRLFEESFLFPSLFEPAMGRVTAPNGTNMWETNDSYIVQFVMPGMKADSISCNIDQNVLTCTGESAMQVPENATRVWQSYGGKAEYRVQLPAEVEAERAQAAYEQGILTITLPKAATARTHQIKVTSK